MTQALPNDPAWLRAAFGDLGLKEIKGKKHAARVVEMFAQSGHAEVKNDETAWCSAATNAWMAQAGIKGTGALNARSWLNWGKPVTGKIARGTICVFKRGTSTWEGHVGICLEDKGGTITLLSANVSDSVCIKPFKRSTMIGARWPNSASNSVTVQAFAGTAVSSGGAQAAGETANYLDKVASLPIEEGLTQAQELAQQAALYLRWAQYALVAIGVAIALYGAWRFIHKWLHPDNDILTANDKVA